MKVVSMSETKKTKLLEGANQMNNLFQPYSIFENGNYIETVTHELNGVRIVHCTDLGISKLYRIEYGINFNQHSVCYDEITALNMFHAQSQCKEHGTLPTNETKTVCSYCQLPIEIGNGVYLEENWSKGHMGWVHYPICMWHIQELWKQSK